MSRFTNIADGPIRNCAKSRPGMAVVQALRDQATSYRLYWFSAALLLAVLPFAARSAGDFKIPADYRSWFHVNTLIVDKTSSQFAALGGMHIIHINAKGVPALKKGGPYPDGTMFLDDVHDVTVSDGFNAEGALKGLTFMVKNAKMYASTGGWGFQFWAEGDPKKPMVTMPPNNASNATSRRKTTITSIRLTSREAPNDAARPRLEARCSAGARWE